MYWAFGKPSKNKAILANFFGIPDALASWECQGEDNIAEIYIRKHVSVEDKLSVFEKLNLFNSKYRGMSFFLDNEMVCVKSYCATGGDIQVALLMLARNMETAQELFAEFV